MSSNFIAETEQIRKAFDLINEIELEKFPLLAQRIALKIHSSTETSFKQEEIEKLEQSLNLTTESIILVIDILEFVYLQACYELIKPTVLKSKLIGLKMDENKVDAICEIWREHGKLIMEKIRQTKTISTKRLKNVNWRLNLQLATDLKSKQKLPNALFEFNLIDANKLSADASMTVNAEESVQIEFGREDLFEFMNKLETIQRQLDALNSN